jgi:hypothetical protein
MRHLPGDEDEIVADDGRNEARAGGRTDTWWIDLVNLIFRHHCDQRGRDIGLGGKTALHHHRGARRYVIAEFGVPGEVIGMDRSGGRIILVKADAVAEVGAELVQNAPHSLQNEIALASAAWPSEQRKA